MTDGPLSAVDRPNSYIGRSVPRPNARRLVAGAGSYTDDIRLPRLAHAVFLRSPYAHARILAIDTAAAKRAPGVIAVVTGAELAKVCSPWVGVLHHLKGLKSAPQHAIAVDHATWQGEPVCAVVARSRAEAEDALGLIEVTWQELPAVTEMETALDAATPVIHPDLGDNLAFTRTHVNGEVDALFAGADRVVQATFHTGRHTGVTLEPRSIIGDWAAAERRLTVYHSTQAPHMMQTVFAKHLTPDGASLREGDVRVVCKDVGGSYGIKVHVYPDEVATVALSCLLKRPVKFVADRLESFASDIHARDHRIHGRLAVRNDGSILAFDIDDLTGIGPYSVYPRTSAVEGNQVVNLCGGPYAMQAYRAKTTVVFQNKTPTCQYRAVGHPIAAAVTEGLVDLAAAAIGMDPAEIRRRNVIKDDAYPHTNLAGLRFEALSHQACLTKLLAMMDYDALKAERDALRARGVYRGIGLAAFIELTNPSPFMYGIGGARISAMDGATLRMDPDGTITVASGVTEQGQGTEAIFAQIAAHELGVPMAQVRVITGDTDTTPYGGGTWASRGAGIGGEAVLQSARALKAQILLVAGAMLQADPGSLDISEGQVRDASGPRLALEEVGRVVYFRGDTLPKDLPRELMATRHWTPKEYPFCFTNGMQASYVEVDTETGFVTLLKHWCVEDCGTVINPQLVDEQIRGGVVQGIGGALYEHCLYSPEGQLLTGSMADYLVPMAADMPDIAVAHVETPTRESALGAKGAGEAGTAGAPAAIMNAINDALRPLSATVFAQPFTPARILEALKKI